MRATLELLLYSCKPNNVKYAAALSSRITLPADYDFRINHVAELTSTSQHCGCFRDQKQQL